MTTTLPSKAADFFGDLRTLLEQGKDLPTLPRVVLELHHALDDELVSSDEIATIVERDPALAVRLLRMANSALFYRGVPVGDIRHALRLLGLQQVRWLCVAISVVNSFRERRGGLSLRTFWQHSAGVALITSRLAKCLNFRAVPSEQLYVGGLLHDVGLLLLDQYFPDLMRRCLVSAQLDGRPLAHVEYAELGMSHAEVGALLLGRWTLPPTLVAMVAGHHQPTAGTREYRGACWLVYAAEQICQAYGLALSLEGIPEERGVAIVDAIRAAGFDINTVMQDVPDKANELATVFT